tara:strand:+ start:400 stop:588 length:189 start_codon:yes stop_codon:yes gene_type:complete
MACEVWWHALHGRVSHSDVLRVVASMITELKATANENRRLKRMYAEMSMQNDLLKEVLGKKR